jgi:7-cyano-7-deazaguanine synthase
VIGACETDFSGYPDCRESFMNAQQETLSLALGQPMTIHRPLMNLSKADIFALADSLGVLELVIHRTHTCYTGERERLWEWGYGCGTCPACELRQKGFEVFQNQKKSQLKESSRG